MNHFCNNCWHQLPLVDHLATTGVDPTMEHYAAGQDGGKADYKQQDTQQKRVAGPCCVAGQDDNASNADKAPDPKQEQDGGEAADDKDDNAE